MRRVMLSEGGARPGRRRVLALLAAAIAPLALLVTGIALALPGSDGATGMASGPQHPAEFASAQVTTPARRRVAKARRGGARGADDQPECEHDPRTRLVLRAVDRVLGASPVRAQHAGVRARARAAARARQRAARATDRRRLGRPFVLDAEEDDEEDAGWAFAVTPAFLARLRSLVERDRVKLIVDLNLVTDTPLTAATWAHAAETSLPRGSIIGFEVGNEPDIYAHSYWVATIARSPLEARPLPLELTPGQLRQRLRRVRAGPRRGRARRAADRAGGGAPQGQPEVDQDADRRRAPRARGRERAPVSLLRLRQARVQLELSDRRAPAQLAGRGRAGQGRRGRRQGRARRRPEVPPDRAQLGHVRRKGRRQQHVRDRPVGARCAVHADAGRGGQRQPARPGLRDQRAVLTDAHGHSRRGRCSTA